MSCSFWSDICCSGVLSGVGNSRVRDLSKGEFSGRLDAAGGVEGAGSNACGVYCRARGCAGLACSGVLGGVG